MDRLKVLNVLNALQHSLAHDPDYMDLSGCAPELKWIINEYQKLIDSEEAARNEYYHKIQEFSRLQKSYVETAGKLKRFKKRMNQIREIAGRENPSIKDIRYLADGYEMREDK